MAAADTAVLTSDNPRSEDPRAIVEAMLTGVAGPRSDRVRIELDRRRAIRLAAELARPGDVVLVTGKGHEVTHEVAGEKLPFDDRVQLRAALRLAFPLSELVEEHVDVADAPEPQALQDRA
jgi:UDP-N-acetylmuramoyl-L-alanyl-D-glutamate--2,6-diaminopimelate ligase